MPFSPMCFNQSINLVSCNPYLTLKKRKLYSVHVIKNELSGTRIHNHCVTFSVESAELQLHVYKLSLKLSA